MAPATRLLCPLGEACTLGQGGEDGTPYKTPEHLATIEQTQKDMESHIAAHTLLLQMKSQNSETKSSAPASGARADKLRRPEVSEGMTDADWEYFKDCWERYKKSARLEGETAAAQLWDCCSQDLARRVYDSGMSRNSSEVQLLERIKNLAIKAQNKLCNIVTFFSMKQAQDEGSGVFLARLKGQGAVCDFTTQCKCVSGGQVGSSVSFADIIIKYQFVCGLHNSDIREKVLSAAAVKEMDLEETAKLAQASEMGKTSSEILKTSAHLNRMSSDGGSGRGGTGSGGQGTGRKNAFDGKEKKCSHCGKQGHTSKTRRDRNCPALNHKCEKCHKVGHFGSQCYSKPAQTASIKEENEEDLSAELGAFFNISAAQPEKCSSDEFFQCLEEKWLPSYCLEELTSEEAEELRLTSAASLELELDTLLEPELGSLPPEVAGSLLSVKSEERKEFCVLSHQACDKFGVWASTRVEDHPVVTLEVGVDTGALHSLKLRQPKHPQIVKCSCLADTGAQIDVMGPQQSRKFGLKEDDLVAASLGVSVANNQGLKLLGAAFLTLMGKDSQGKTRKSRRMVYVAEGISSFFLSRASCRELGIIGPTFPEVGTFSENGSLQSVKTEEHETEPCKCPVRVLPPPPPASLPYPGTAENVQKLEDFIKNHYKASTMNMCEHQPLPLIKGSPPLELHLDTKARPVACHRASPVPIHYQNQVKADIDRDVRLGVLEPVPIGTPTTWISRMVIQAKKSGKPRRTVDLQPVNRHCLRQTHPVKSPFHQATAVPPNTVRTTMDAWNGYHSVPLKEEDRHVTTFLTPWGRYRYNTAPQGFIAAGDVYCQRYDFITRDFGEDFERCVDDTILWSNSIEENFYRTCEYLSLVGAHGITINPDKFNFGKEELEYLGFWLTKESVEPGEKLLHSIRDFPRPRDVTGIRAWFGLVEQCAYSFSKCEVMAPFKPLLSPSAAFRWDEDLQEAFDQAKDKIIESVKEGVKNFNPDRTTCVSTDWSKVGISFLVMQKHCLCPEVSPVCCTSGWKVTFCNSRFTSPAESRYSPVEGECLAVAWALKKAKYWVLGARDLWVATDHKPLLGLLNDKALEGIENPRLLRLKEKTLVFNFRTVHVEGLKNRSADAGSRYPAGPGPQLWRPWKESDDLGSIAHFEACTEEEFQESLDIEIAVLTQIQCSLESLEEPPAAQLLQHTVKAVTLERVKEETGKDPVLKQLGDLLKTGLPEDKAGWPKDLLPFFASRRGLGICDGAVTFKERVVIPTSLQEEVLGLLHQGSQGATSMIARAATSVWWPKIQEDITRKRLQCGSCDRNAPSQPHAPPTPLPCPEYPFQLVVSDYFEYNGKFYVHITDRYSNWPSLYEAGKEGAAGLVKILRHHFCTYGIPEEMASDDGPQYRAEVTQKFLRDWNVKWRVSASYNPHSNTRAEVAVKTLKRMIRENLTSQGTLNSDKFSAAMLTYRNTPCRDTKLSPAQIIFGHQLRDFIPVKPGQFKPRQEWILTYEAREKALSKRHLLKQEVLTEHSKELPPLKVGDVVSIQNQRGNNPLKWDRSGVVVEVLQFDKYRVKTDGSGIPTVRNRRFLRKIWPYGVKNEEMKQLAVDQKKLEDRKKVVRCSSRERSAPEDLHREPETAEQRRSGRERSAPDFLGVKPKGPSRR